MRNELTYLNSISEETFRWLFYQFLKLNSIDAWIAIDYKDAALVKWVFNDRSTHSFMPPKVGDVIVVVDWWTFKPPYLLYEKYQIKHIRKKNNKFIEFAVSEKISNNWVHYNKKKRSFKLKKPNIFYFLKIWLGILK